MGETSALAARFERERERLLSIARGILHSRSDAEDAVQDAWLRLAAQGPETIGNLPGWLTTTVTRICLDQLRYRRVRAEDAAETSQSEDVPAPIDIESDVALAQSVGLAMFIVLETLEPPERIAFVLHDILGVPFAKVAGTLGRSVDATRQVASRARRRLLDNDEHPVASVARQLDLADRYLSASRNGDMDTILSMLDPDVKLAVDDGTRTTTTRGAANVAGKAVAFRGRALEAELAAVEGNIALAQIVQGRLVGVLFLGFSGARISRVEIVTDPARLHEARVVRARS